MKTELLDVNETRKNLVVEIPTDVVDAEIAKVSAKYGKRGAAPRLPARQGAAESRSSSGSRARSCTMSRTS